MKKRTLLFTAVVLLCGLSCTSYGARFYDGNELYESLRTENSNSHKYASALAYVSGVADSLQFNGDISMPVGLTKGQVGDMVDKFLRENPERRLEPAASLIYEVMVKKFPNKHK